MKKIFLTAVICLFLVAALVGCTPKQESPAQDAVATKAPVSESQESNAPDTADASWDRIKEKGEIIMGMDDSFPPMGFVNESGELTGFDVELAQAIGEQLGVKIKLQSIDWKAKEMELGNGNIDVIWNGYTITPERIERVLMSPPYMSNAQVVIVKEDSTLAALSDLAGKKVGVQDGSSAQDAILANEELAKSIGEQIDFKDNVTALLDVSSSQIDALAVDLVVAEYYLSKKPGEYKILEETLAPEEYGIGFRKDEQAFHDAVVKAFKDLHESGKTTELSMKWFGRDVIKTMP